VAIGVIAFFCLWNANAIITGNIGTMFVPRDIHEEYFRYRQWLNAHDDSFRVLAVPAASKWMAYTNTHPKMSLIDLVRGKWDEFSLPAVDGHPERAEKNLLSPLEQKFSNSLLDRSAIRYVAVPRDDPENVDNLFEVYGRRDILLTHLDALPYLSRIDSGTGDVVVYENSGVRPRWYIANTEETTENVDTVLIHSLDVEMISPSEYRLRLREEMQYGEGKYWQYLYFAESYHPDWNVYSEEFSWWDTIWREKSETSDTKHNRTDIGLNEFVLSEDMAKRLVNGESITIFFRPQAYLSAGLAISGFVLAVCLGFLAYIFWKSRRNRAIIPPR
jgi:hypothetical protein